MVNCTLTAFLLCPAILFLPRLMRPLVIFFFFLCLHLLGGYGAACASNHACKAGRLPVYNCVKTPGVEQGMGKPLLFNTSHDVPEGSECLLFAEDNDQEDSTKKSRSPVEGFSVYLCALTSGSPAHDLATGLVFRRHSSCTTSCRYIVLRVLRI